MRRESQPSVTVVVGASRNPERYSNLAVRSLSAAGHPVIPVHPVHGEIEGFPAVRGLSEITTPVDTVTLYVNPRISSKLKDSLLQLKPRRVVFNPGAENAALKQELEGGGIECVEGCTLVMLRTRTF